MFNLSSGSTYSMARRDVCYPEDYVNRFLQDTNLYGITQQKHVDYEFRK